MKIVLCFYGLNRSLSITIGMIQRNIFRPLQRMGITFETHAAFMEPAGAIMNPRSREFNIRPERGNEALLAARNLIRIDQAQFDRTFDFAPILAEKDPWDDSYVSVHNVCRALKSLEAVTDSWVGLAQKSRETVFCYLRPDLIYHDPLPVDQLLHQFAIDGENMFLTPAWATYGGINDRIACLGRRAAMAYGRRIHRIDEFLRAQTGGLHAESFVKFVATDFSADRQPPLLMRASRLRANGRLREELFENSSGKPLPFRWAVAAGLAKKQFQVKRRMKCWKRDLRDAGWRFARQGAGVVMPLFCGAGLSRVATVPDPGVGIREIAADAWGESSVNVAANSRRTLLTHDDWQFAAYYDVSAHLVLARRSLPSGGWETVRTRHRGRVEDAHNSISLGVDAAGFLHVAWDHHGSPLKYARGTAPGSLVLGDFRSMTGRRERAVTYPQFYVLPDGNLLFFYRSGGSGNGALVLNRYCAATGVWRQVQENLIDGEGMRSPYWGVAIDPKGGIHLSWMWRDSPDVATNHDLAYAHSRDGGETWTRSDGTPCVLPMTAANAEYALRIGPNCNLMNPPEVTADASGHPCIVSYWSSPPDAPPRFNVLWHDGANWSVLTGPAQSVPFRLAGEGTRRPVLSRAGAVARASPTGRFICLVYRDDGRGGRIIGAIGDLASREWQEKELTLGGLGAWEPSVDAVAWERFGEIQMLVSNVNQRNGDDSGGGVSWPRVIGGMHWMPFEPATLPPSDQSLAAGLIKLNESSSVA